MNNNRFQRSIARYATLGVLLLATGCASIDERDNDGGQYDALQRRPQAKTDYQHVGAADGYEHISQQSPSNVDGLFRQGAAAYRRADLTGAERYFTKVLEQDPKHSRATYNLAMIHLHRAYDGLVRYVRFESSGPRQSAVQDLIRRLDNFNAGQ